MQCGYSLVDTSCLFCGDVWEKLIYIHFAVNLLFARRTGAVQRQQRYIINLETVCTRVYSLCYAWQRTMDMTLKTPHLTLLK